MQLPRYGPGARFYDVASMERPVYRTGRLAAVRALQLERGDRVLDIGCGTGLNLAPLRAAAPDLWVVGVDASPAMLAQARRRTASARAERVELIEADAAGVLLSGPPFDAALTTYALSVIAGWEAAWERMFAAVRPGGRIAVLDMAPPVGAAAALRPLARFAAFTGGADLSRAPWRLLERDAIAVSHTTLRGGHLHLVAGTKPGGRPDVRVGGHHDHNVSGRP